VEEESVVLTHERADFDALASLIAAVKLYPNARPYLCRNLPGPVKNFLSLYQDVFPIPCGVPLDFIPNRLVIVDTQQKESLGMYQSMLEKVPPDGIIIYDHHPTPENPIQAKERVIEERGATVSILLDRLWEMHIPITPLEATLFALGLYADTGLFTFPLTHPSDLRSAAELLERGADLGIVRQYLHMSLTEKHRTLLDALMWNQKNLILQGHSLTLTQASLPEEVSDLSLVVTHLQEILAVPTLFSLMEFPGVVYLLGRTENRELNLLPAIQRLGGNGHPSAVVARLKQTSLNRAERLLLKALEETLVPPLVAWDVMSSPVHGVTVDATVKEALEEMQKYGHSGLVVWDEEGNLAGILTRKDVDKAIRLNMWRSSVKGFMTPRVLSVSPTTTLPEIQQLFVQHGIGRVIVLGERGTVAGIVTRKDILRRSTEVASAALGRSTAVQSALQSRVPLPLLTRLKEMGQIAENLGMKAYLVGGSVRDILLGLPVGDWDILVEGDGLRLAERITQFLGGDLQTYPQFKTASIRWEDGFRVDVATAREEYYEKPASLPRVIPSSLKADLYRRDFTIHTLAILLNPRGFGNLVDYFNGFQDLQSRVIRVLHNLSFVEDPTRIFRAIRYEQRLGFRVEEKTLSLMQTALSQKALRKLSGDRLRNELCHIFQEASPRDILLRMENLKIFTGIHPRLTLRVNLFFPEDWVRKASTLFSLNGAGEKNILYLLVLSSSLPLKDAEEFLMKMRLDRKGIKNVHLLSVQSQLVSRLEKASRNSTLYQILHGLPVEFLAYLWVMEPSIRSSVERYWSTLRHITLTITGDHLREAGISPGPEVGKILRRVLWMKLDGKIKEEEELTTAIQKYSKK